MFCRYQTGNDFILEWTRSALQNGSMPFVNSVSYYEQENQVRCSASAGGTVSHTCIQFNLGADYVHWPLQIAYSHMVRANSYLQMVGACGRTVVMCSGACTHPHNTVGTA